MVNYQELANVKGNKVLLRVGNVSVEPKLLVEVEGQKTQVDLTLNSADLENSLGEFVLNERVSEDVQTEVLSEIAKSTVEVNGFKVFTLKEKYMKKLVAAVELEKSKGEYFNI